MLPAYDVESHVPSLHSRTWNALLRPTFKQLSRILPGSRLEIRLLRVVSEWGSVLAGADAIPHAPVLETTGEGEVRGEWVGSAPAPGDKVMLYTHGSAYVVCSPRTHRAFVAALSRRTGRRAFSLDYRLGPEHHFPAAHEDIVAAYVWLLGLGHRPEDIILAGDSAGGHLSLSLCGELRRRGLAMPAGLVLFSPLVDGSFAAAADEYRRSGDPAVVPAFARRLIRHHLRTAEPGDPRFDVSLDAGPDMPPTLIVSGKGEMMRGDALLWQRVQAAVGGGHLEVQIWPGQAHVFSIFGLVPEARLAMVEVARFVAQLDHGWFDGHTGGNAGDGHLAAEA
jgi:monoterpene epsilon-lactone hydrolase